ncbi:MAG: ABC transporter ATP-binding protein, partial [Burkholderiales bacterium]
MNTPDSGPQAGDRWPRLWSTGRRSLVLAVLALGLMQALSMAGMAWGIRASFIALHTPGVVRLWPLAIVVMAGFLLALARWQENKLSERLGQRFANDVRARLFEARALSTGLPRRGPSDRTVLQQLTSDMSAIRLWVGKGVLRSLVSAFRLGSLCVILAWWMPSTLALGVLVCMALGLAGMYLVSTRLTRVHRRLNRARAGLTRFLTERLPQAAALRLAGRLSRETESLTRRTKRLECQAVHRQQLHGLMRSIPDGVRGLSVAWVLAVAMTRGLSAADTAACLAMVGLMIPGLRDLAGVWDRRAAEGEVRRRLRPWLNSQAERSKEAAVAGHERGPRPSMAPDVEDHAATTLALQPGQKVLLKARDAQSCRLWLQTLANTTAEHSRHALLDALPHPPSVTLVNRHAPMLGGSLRRAATLGSARRPGDAKVLRVLKEVGLWSLVDRVGGLDGRVGWSGEGLSDDERSRLLLARAMLSRSDLVLLDELPLAWTPELDVAVGRWLLRSKATVVLAHAYSRVVEQH